MSKHNLLYSRILLLFLACLGVFLQFYKYGGGMAMYYTILSNILVAIFMAYLVYAMVKKPESHWTSQRFFRIKAGVTMAIMITCVVYHLMLAPLAEDFHRLENYLCHYIVPLYLLLDTLFVDARRQYRWFDPFIWALTPLLYCVFAIFNGLVTKIPVPEAKDSPFPYFFVNVTKHGWAFVLQYSAVICVAYILAGFLLYSLKTYRLPVKNK